MLRLDVKLHAPRRPHFLPGAVSSGPEGSRHQRRLPQIGHFQPLEIQSAVIDADNRYVAIDGDTLQVWEIATGQKVAESSRLGVSSLQLSAEGDVLLSQVESSVRSWRFSDLKEVKRLRGEAAR